jgi:hypothetical protein
MAGLLIKSFRTLPLGNPNPKEPPTRPPLFKSAFVTVLFAGIGLSAKIDEL